jgi:TolB protein
MRRSRLIAILFSAIALAPAIAASAQSMQPGHYGIFDGSTDVGIAFPGSTAFNPYSGTLRNIGGGADMWGTADGFHIAWVKLKGDASISADVEFPDKTPSPLAKAVLIFRQNLDPDSPYADVAVHADGHITLQYRDKKGGETADIVSPISASKRLRIERHGDVFTASDPVFVGVGSCAHDVKSTVTVNFSHIEIERFGK